MAKGVYERSSEQKKRLAELCKKNVIGRRPSFGMLGKRQSSEARAKIAEWCRLHPELLTRNKGIKLTPEQLSKRLGRWKGAKSPLWQGGKTSKHATIRASFEYKQWRKAVFERDGYLCVMGGLAHGHNLHVDHIKPFSHIIIDNNIKLLADAIACSSLWDITNGRTLCVDCHKKTDTYLSGALKKQNVTIH
jgi:hypothetical protein